jgi:hypothetical protein
MGLRAGGRPIFDRGCFLNPEETRPVPSIGRTACPGEETTQ